MKLILGCELEVPNSIIDHLTEDLYEAKLVYYSDTFDNRVRSFCMNPGELSPKSIIDGELL